MNRTWTLTDLEFVALWREVGEYAVPRPFAYTTEGLTTSDYERIMRENKARLTRSDPDLPRIFQELENPDIGIVVRGLDGKDPKNPKGALRLLAGRRETRGYVVKQLPGKTMEYSGGFVIEECDALALAEVIAAKFPDKPAGTQGSVRIPVPEDEEDQTTTPQTSSVWDETPAATSGPTEAGRAFAKIRPEFYGWITVRQGISRFGPQGRVTRGIHFRDLPDDGRYLIAEDNPTHAVPADRAGLVKTTNRQIAAIVAAIKDQRK